MGAHWGGGGKTGHLPPPGKNFYELVTQ